MFNPERVRRSDLLPSRRAAAGRPASAKQAILVVEDDPRLSTLLEQELGYSGYAVTSVRTGAEALVTAEEGEFALILLDLNLPDFDGLEVAERLHGRVDADILMVTARGEVRDRVAGLYAGASDYLVKPFSVQELLARVHARLRGRAQPSSLDCGPVTLDLYTNTCRVADQVLALSSYELDVLRLLLSNPGRIFSKEDLENRLYGPELPASNTVEVFVSRLRAKLGEAGARGVLQTVRGLGYVMYPPS